MMRHLYGAVMALIQPLYRRKLAQRALKEPGYGEAVDERWGIYQRSDQRSDTDKGDANPAGGWIWMHAVSLGETRAAAVLLAKLRESQPDMRLLLTHGTATGRAEGRALLRPGDLQVWQPWDAPAPVKRFLAHFKPTLGLLLETEIWPTLTAACQAKGIPLVLVNARLSEKSLRMSQRLAWLSRPAYAALTAVYAQSADDGQRLQRLGAPVKACLGNIKFDAMPSPALLERGRQWRALYQSEAPPGNRAGNKPVVLFASSREGEEALLLQCLDKLPDEARRAIQWLIVPRHPQRFDDVAALVQSAGYSLSRRSQWSAAGPSANDAVDIWLGDSLGEMPAYYALASVALLGGSYMPLGGQNLIEAAACACPVVMGPHTFNFAEAAENSARAGAAFPVMDLPQAMEIITLLLADEPRLAQAREASSAFVQAHRGATLATVSALLPYLTKPSA